MTVRSLFALAICAALTTRQAAATADDVLITEGLELRRQGRDAEARDRFERALKLRPSPRGRVQLALAEQALGHWVKAERDLLEALRSSDDPWIASRKELLERSLATIQDHLGTLVVESNVSDAVVRIADGEVGALPVPPQRVAAGKVLVELVPAAGPPVQRSIEIAAGETVIQRFEILVQPAPDAPATMATTQTPSFTTPKLRATARGETLGPAKVREAFAWGMASVSLASLSAGLVLQGIHALEVQHYNEDARCVRPNLTRDQVCGHHRGRAEMAQRVAVASYVTAGSAAAAAAILFFTGDRRSRSAALRPWVSIEGQSSSIGCSGHF